MTSCPLSSDLIIFSPLVYGDAWNHPTSCMVIIYIIEYRIIKPKFHYFNSLFSLSTTWNKSERYSCVHEGNKIINDKRRQRHKMNRSNYFMQDNLKIKAYIISTWNAYHKKHSSMKGANDKVLYTMREHHYVVL